MTAQSKLLQFGNKADAYLEWAQHTGFAHFDGVLPTTGDKQIGLLVRWEQQPGNLQDLLTERCAAMAEVYLSKPVGSISVQQTCLVKLFDPKLGVSFAELATPLAVNGTADKILVTSSFFPTMGDASEVLLGCIDDGFPIASEQYHRAGPARLARFWNQENNPPAIGKDLGYPGVDPDGTNFGYGSELVPPKLKSATMSNPPEPAQLEKGATKSRWALPNVEDAKDDFGYYQRTQLRRSMHRATHGAHVLDVFSGDLPVRSRVSASRGVDKGEDSSATKPPSRSADGSLAATAPIVLVQLPSYALDDPSGRWLGRNVLDGLHYIVQTAKFLDEQRKDAKTFKKIVINLSWGPQTGPHDGKSLLEVAIDDLIAQEKNRSCTLEVTLPAGNSYEARAHAAFPANKGANLCWCVPPGARSPAFLEIWWPIGTAGEDAQLTVTAPDGTTLSTLNCLGIWSQPPGCQPAKIRWGITKIEHPGGFMALIALAPTFSHNPIDATAPHGQWHIEVEALSSNNEAVHVYVARADHNMGTKRRAQPSYLRDVAYEKSRRSVKAERTKTVRGSMVQKSGTLNGIGTGKATKMAAGYRLSDGLPARYSSSGPARGSRLGPDYAYPTEVSRMVHGIPGSGTRSGTVVNLSGTSTAAPQYARDLVKATDTVRQKPPPPPGPSKPIDPRFGGGKR